MKTSIGMRQKCNIPWNSNEEMNDCMDNDEKRAHLVTYFSSKKYKDRLIQAQKNTDERDALIVYKGKVKGVDVVAVSSM